MKDENPEKDSVELPELDEDFDLEAYSSYMVEEEELKDEDPVHPSHYKGDLVMRIIEHFGYDKDAYLFNVIKYSLRFSTTKNVTDLEKAAWYLARKISRIK